MGALQQTIALGMEQQYAPMLAKLQGYILVSHGRRHVWLGMLRFQAARDQEKQELRARMARWGQQATSALCLREMKRQYQESADEQARQDAKSALVSAVGISISGYAALDDKGRPPDPLFRAGFANRFQEYAAGSNPYDAVILLASEDAEGQLENARRDVEESLAGLAEVHWEKGAVLKPNGTPVDNFGFAEDISQPVFFASENQRNPNWQSGWNPAAWLNLVLTPQNDQTDPDEYGSYMAFLKVEQDIRGFNQLVEETAQATQATPEQVKAWILGRTKGGQTLLPGATDPNDFDFSMPGAGACPMAAHIRKMNPRIPNQRHHRIVRRGVFYADDATGEKGALFQCFQSDLGIGFEHLFTQWGLADFPEGAGQDPILGKRNWPPLPAGVPAPPGCATVKRLTRIHYGEYFYFPSLPYFSRLPQR